MKQAESAEELFRALQKTREQKPADKAFGVVEVASGEIPIETVRKFLERLQQLKPSSEERTFESSELRQVGATALGWKRWKVRAADIYIEKLLITDDREQEGLFSSARAGEWTVGARTIENTLAGRLDMQWAAELSRAELAGWVAVNILEVPAAELRSRRLEIRPLLLHALTAQGEAIDRADARMEAAIANAFWQTYWATGALRSQRGVTFPVAFYPIDRTSLIERNEPWAKWEVSPKRTLYGRTSILGYAVEQLTSQKLLSYDPQKNTFVAEETGNAANQRLVRQTLEELNRCAFVDKYTGDNASLAESSGPVLLHRVIPYSGCGFLSDVVENASQLQATQKIQDLEGDIIAGTNSVFFLNFPEEYASIHSAMNDLISLFVENEKLVQLPAVSRASFIEPLGGPWEIRVVAAAERDITPASAAQLPLAAKIAAAGERAVVVGNTTVEETAEEDLILPPNGVVGTRGHMPAVNARWRHAFAVGPLLVQNGKVVELGASGEDFHPCASANTSFEETSELSRCELPESIFGVGERGIAPTRFPYDWDKTRAPRTAIGVRQDGTVLIVVVDGRLDPRHSIGATLEELAGLMLLLGCKDAMNMDGGGSSAMFLKDERAHEKRVREDSKPGLVSLPSDLGGVERLLPVPLVICRRKPERMC